MPATRQTGALFHNESACNMQIQRKYFRIYGKNKQTNAHISLLKKLLWRFYPKKFQQKIPITLRISLAPKYLVMLESKNRAINRCMEIFSSSEGNMLHKGKRDVTILLKSESLFTTKWKIKVEINGTKISK